ncbi:MAG TPA: hypothetical protein VJV75_09825 [Candidatus Polarisedimenticolia bacterium]|nr:hypothetical protein [Candidatus Polarisedimenticolia bacterium]
MLRHLLQCAELPALMFAVLFAGSGVFAAPGGSGPKAIVVPDDYPTIQAAIDAAKRGGRITVLAGTYAEQVAITKDLTIVGAGMDQTIVRAPNSLAPGPLGSPAILEVHAGVRASVSGLTVSGPGAAPCGASDMLRWGVRVDPGATLAFRYGAVRDIQNTPMAMCPRSGTAISVGTSTPGGAPSALNIDHSEVTGFQTTGIIVLGEGSTANIAHNLVAGPGHAGGLPTNGIELVAGAVGTIAHNTVSGNICPDGMPDVCGDDFFTQIQNAGIGAGGSGPGTVITQNLLVGNQIGLFLSECDEISQNVMRDNDYFGMGLVGVTDGSFTIDGGEVTGGGGGIWVTAILVDMTVALNKVGFSGLSGQPVEIIEDGGFTAKVVGAP